MADKILLLSVDGGENEVFLGAFRNRAKLEEMIAEERDGGDFTVENGYVMSEPYVVDDGRECYYVHCDDVDSRDYAICFLIREVEVID